MISSFADPLESIREQIRRGFDRRNEKNIIKVFHRHAIFCFPDAAKPDAFGRCQIVRPCTLAALWLIRKEKLRFALEDLDVLIREDDISRVFNIMDMDDNKGLDLSEFKRAILVSKPEIILD
jgi:hypothetical protein